MVAAVSAWLVLLAASATASEAVTVREVARALRGDSVYVAPAARSRLPARHAARLRRRIARVDRGRIQVAVIPRSSAERAGSIADFSNALDQAMPERRGTLIVATGEGFHAVTSHRSVDPTVAALRRAVRSHRRLHDQLLAAVEGIAAVDPGADADLAGPPGGGRSIPTPTPSPSSSPADDADDVLAVIGLVFGALIVLVLLAVSLPLLIRSRRRRAARSDVQALDRASARDELVALGDDITALDLDVEMPNASRQGREEYERALMLYERASRALGDKEPSEVQLYEAQRAIEEGRARIAAAREALAAGGAPPGPGG